MRAELLNPSKYLKAAEFGVKFPKEPTLTIISAGYEDLVDAKGVVEEKGVMHFKETPKGWCANVINVNCLIAMFGKETDGWKGKRVTLYEDPNVLSFGQIVSGIRVRGSPDLRANLTVKMQIRGKGLVMIELLKTGGAPMKRETFDAATEVIFSRHALHGRAIAELLADQVKQLLEHCTGAKLEPGLKPEHLEQLARQEGALKARLAALTPAAVEPGAEG